MSLRSFLSGLFGPTPAPDAVPDVAPVSFTRLAQVGAGTLRKAVLAPGGSFLAAATSRGVAVFRAGEDERAELLWQQPTASWAVAVAVAGDASVVAGATSDGQVRVWDAVTGTELRALGASGRAALAVDSHGQRLAVGDRAGVTVWDLEAGTQERTLAGNGQEVTAVAFHPEGMQVAAVDHGGHALVWDVETGRELRRWQVTGPLRDVVFGADGAWVAAVGQGWTVWDVETGSQVQHGSAPGPLLSAALSADGHRLAAGTARNRCLVWDLGTGERIAEITGHQDEVHSVAFVSEERMLVGSQKLELVALDLGSRQPVRAWPVFARARHVAVGAGSGSGGRAGSGSGAVTNAPATANDDALVAIADRQVITLWRAGSGASIAVLDGHTAPILGMWLGPDASSLVSFSQREVIAWSWDGEAPASVRQRYALAELGEISGASCAAGIVAVSAAEAGDGQPFALSLWDAAAGTRTAELGTVARRGLELPELLLSPDGRLLAVRTGGHLVVWDVRTRTERWQAQGLVKREGVMAWSPDAQTLATGMDSGAVALWDAATGRTRHTVSGTGGSATGLAFGRGGALLAASFQATSADSVAIWDARTGKAVHSALTGGGAICHGLALSDDGTTLVAGFASSQSAGQEAGAWVAWHVATGAVITRQDDAAIWAVGFGQSGSLLVTASGDGQASIWRVGPGSK